MLGYAVDLKTGDVIEVGSKKYIIRSADDRFVSYDIEGGAFSVMYGMVSRKFFMDQIVGQADKEKEV